MYKGEQCNKVYVCMYEIRTYTNTNIIVKCIFGTVTLGIEHSPLSSILTGLAFVQESNTSAVSHKAKLAWKVRGVCKWCCEQIRTRSKQRNGFNCAVWD